MAIMTETGPACACGRVRDVPPGLTNVNSADLGFVRS